MIHFFEMVPLQRLEAFTRSSVKVDASRGGTFVLFNGNVTGKFQELVSQEICEVCFCKQDCNGTANSRLADTLLLRTPR